jgi:hypothetical protein
VFTALCNWSTENFHAVEEARTGYDSSVTEENPSAYGISPLYEKAASSRGETGGKLLTAKVCVQEGGYSTRIRNALNRSLQSWSHLLRFFTSRFYP